MTFQKMLTYPFLQILFMMVRVKDESLVQYAEHLAQKKRMEKKNKKLKQ